MHFSIPHHNIGFSILNACRVRAVLGNTIGRGRGISPEFVIAASTAFAILRGVFGFAAAMVAIALPIAAAMYL